MIPAKFNFRQTDVEHMNYKIKNIFQTSPPSAHIVGLNVSRDISRISIPEFSGYHWHVIFW